MHIARICSDLPGGSSCPQLGWEKKSSTINRDYDIANNELTDSFKTLIILIK